MKEQHTPRLLLSLCVGNCNELSRATPVAYIVPVSNDRRHCPPHRKTRRHPVARPSRDCNSAVTNGGRTHNV